MFLSTTTKQFNTSLLKPISTSILGGINSNRIKYQTPLLNNIAKLPTTNIINKRFHSVETADELTAAKQGFNTEKNSGTNYNNNRKKEKKEKKRMGFVNGG